MDDGPVFFFFFLSHRLFMVNFPAVIESGSDSKLCITLLKPTMTDSLLDEENKTTPLVKHVSSELQTTCGKKAGVAIGAFSLFFFVFLLCNYKTLHVQLHSQLQGFRSLSMRGSSKVQIYHTKGQMNTKSNHTVSYLQQISGVFICCWVFFFICANPQNSLSNYS